MNATVEEMILDDLKEIKEGIEKINGQVRKNQIRIAQIIAIGSVLIWLVPLILRYV